MATPAELAAKKLAWEFETRKSIELRFTTSITNHLAGPNQRKGFDTIEEHYIETAAGQRFSDYRGLTAGRVIYHSQHFGDGKRFADLDFSPKNPDRQMNMIIKRHFATEGRNDHMRVPAPILYLYVGREPMHKALPKGEYLGTDKVLGRDCDMFLFPKVRWSVVQDQVFHLDRETGIPLKFEAYANKEARERKEPIADWAAESLDKVQGHYIPLKSIAAAKAPDGSSSHTWHFTVKSVEFDKDYPASTFWPTAREGVTMLDTTTGKAKTLPRNEKAEPKAQPVAATSTLSTQALPPENWNASVSNISLGLGSTVLLAGLFLWSRRK